MIKRLWIIGAGVAILAGLNTLDWGSTFQSSAQSSPDGTEAAPNFDIASIKPRRPGERGGHMGFLPGGRFRAINVPVKVVICEAYQIQYFQLSGPNWIASERYDIEAKPDDSGVPEPGHAAAAHKGALLPKTS